jgi:hypothetical protein
MKRNKIVDKNKINAGDPLIIQVNIATHVPTKAPTSTRAPGTIVPPVAAATATATKLP